MDSNHLPRLVRRCSDHTELPFHGHDAHHGDGLFALSSAPLSCQRFACRAFRPELVRHHRIELCGRPPGIQAPITICRIKQASLAHSPWEEASTSRRPIRESARAYSTGGESLCPAIAPGGGRRRIRTGCSGEGATREKISGRKPIRKRRHAAVCLAPEPILHRLPRSGAFAPEDHFREVTKMVSPSFPHRLRRASFPPRQA